VTSSYDGGMEAFDKKMNAETVKGVLLDDCHTMLCPAELFLLIICLRA
jgi:hypothetical protein